MIRCTYHLAVWVWRQKWERRRWSCRFLKRWESWKTSEVVEQIVLRWMEMWMLLDLRIWWTFIMTDQWETIQIGCRRDCSHHMLHEEIPFLSLRCSSKPLRIQSLECPVFFFNKKIHGYITQLEGDIPVKSCLFHIWNTPSRRQGRGVRMIGSRLRSLVKAIPEKLSVLCNGVEIYVEIPVSKRHTYLPETEYIC